ncbi:hypothetical protein GF373_17815 [bacterium]|nr:hypothetical protein [bacterium]
MIRIETRVGKPGLYSDDIPDKNMILGAIGRIPGVRGRRRNKATFPAEPRLLELLLRRVPQLKLSPDAQEWYESRRAQEESRARLIDRKDADIDYPKADLLRPYQRVGADFVAQAGRSMLCDDCGLGKTVETIAAVEMTPRSEQNLVVCPNSLKLFWKSEIEKWSTLDLPVVIVNSETRERDFRAYRNLAPAGAWMVINYEQLILTDELEKILWDWIIFDESHRLKNRKTQTYGAAQRLDFRRMVLLTGTPFGNDASDLWAQLHLIEPKHFSSYWRFYELFVEYYEDYFEHKHITGVRNVDLLRKELASRVVQRKKEEIADELPGKTYQTIPLELTDLQRKIYRQMAEEMLIELESGEVVEAVNTMSMITRLRQIVGTPAAFDFDDESSKLDEVMELVEKYKKVVVFAQFRAPVQALAKRLEKADIPHVTVLGGLGDEVVADRVERFQADEDCRVFVGTAQTGGVGLTLTSAPVVIFVSQPWSPIKQHQAEDRVHRIGQTDQVHIINLVCPGTTDDLVDGVLSKKIQMTEAVLREKLINSLKPWMR